MALLNTQGREVGSRVQEGRSTKKSSGFTGSPTARPHVHGEAAAGVSGTAFRVKAPPAVTVGFSGASFD